MKKLFKKLFISLMAFTALAGVVFAGTNSNGTINDETWLVRTLSVTNKSLSNSSWSTSTDIDSSKLLSFDLHYFLNSGSASNVKFFIDNLDGRTFNAGDTITVNGRVTASDRTARSGSVTVHFTEKVKLHYYYTS